LVSRAIKAASLHGAAIPGMPVTDTVKLVDAQAPSRQRSTAPRCARCKTPQAFRYETLLDAHRRAAAAGRDDFTDDGALVEWAGLRVSVFEGEAGNIKMTTADDFARAERDAQATLSDIRTGIGYDIHSFDNRRRWRLARRHQIPHTRKAFRALRRRRRTACAGGCDSRCAGRRRHRRALPAER